MQRARGVRVRILFINLISKLKTATKKKNPCEGHSSRALTESEAIFQRARITSESVLVLMLNAARDVTEHSMFRSGKIRVLYARPSKVGNMVNAARPRKKWFDIVRCVLFFFWHGISHESRILRTKKCLSDDGRLFWAATRRDRHTAARRLSLFSQQVGTKLMCSNWKLPSA